MRLYQYKKTTFGFNFDFNLLWSSYSISGAHRSIRKAFLAITVYNKSEAIYTIKS